MDKRYETIINEAVEEMKLREKVRGIISEAVYEMFSEKEKAKKSEGSKRNKTPHTTITQQKLGDDMINKSAVLRNCPKYADMSDDALRSLASKFARGERTPDNEGINQIEDAINTAG